MNGVREEGSEAAAADQQCVSEILLEQGPRMKPSAAADEDGRRKVRPAWQGTPVGDDDLRAMREAAERRLHRQSAEPTGISLRQTKPYDGAAPVHDLRRPAG